MFEAAELGRKIPKDDYKKQALALRGELLELQRTVERRQVSRDHRLRRR